MHQQDTLILFAATLLAMRPTITIATQDLARFLQTFLDRSLVSTNEPQKAAVLHILCSTVNKRAVDAAEFLNVNVQSFWSSKIADSTVDLATRKAALRSWSWVSHLPH